MRSLIRRWIPIFVAILTGVVVLLGYLFPKYVQLIYRGRVVELRDILVEWAVIVAAFALLLGVFNILRVRGQQILRRREGRFYSLVLVFAILVGASPAILPEGTLIQETLNHVVFDYIISPLGASLAALVVFTLTLAAFRMLRTRPSVGAVVFLLIVAVVLLGSVFIGLEGIRGWIVNVPGMAGMRGLLLGVALGTIITGLRVFVASERPYSEF